MATMNVSLPGKMKDWVEQQAETGRYANASDYVRDLIRKDQERNKVFAELRELVSEGIESGMSDRTMEEIRESAKAEFLAGQRHRAM